MTKDEIIEKLWSKTIIDKETGCRLWKGARNQLGYGRIAIREEDEKQLHNRYVHKVAYKTFIGIPKNLVLHKDSICPHKNCWNPEHLYDGTYTENFFDNLVKYGHPLKNKTSCLNGHEYTLENTKIMKNGHRMCLTCFSIRNEKLKIWLCGKRKRG